MKRWLGQAGLRMGQDDGAALKYVALFGGLLFVFGTEAGSWALTLLELLDRVTSQLPQ
jgi:hypothetical protein